LAAASQGPLVSAQSGQQSAPDWIDLIDWTAVEDHSEENYKHLQSIAKA